MLAGTIREISSSDDIIDVRDIIARIEELEDEIPEDVSVRGDGDYRQEREELATLTALMDDLKGNGGDEQWNGDWYPVTLIRDSYFVEAMQELVQDIGDLPAEIPSYLEIDWTATARNLRVDYTSTEFDGVTYWYR